jgi:TatD DNase family protein
MMTAGFSAREGTRLELIDIGANLTNRAFARDLPEVLARARQSGIERMVVTGTTIEGSEAAVELARCETGRLFATAGVHPHHASQLDQAALSRLAELLSCDEVVAVGETGLDYFRDLSPREIQRQAFEAQLQLAADSGKALFLHQRQSHSDFIGILRNWRHRLGNIVVHCFTDQRQALIECLDLDLHIGITGWICDERRGLELRSLVHEIPDERLLLETDCPYLTPRDLDTGSHRNEPANLAHIATTVAALRGVEPQALAALTTANAKAFFNLPD